MHGHKHLVYVLVVLALVYFPFAGKAFTVDDTLFLKAAEQILVSPLDFFGGEVNWYGFPDFQHIINKNPPFVSYLIAAVASLFGFSEIPLHVFFFLPLLLSAIGIYLLGGQFNANPLLTVILAVFTPVFLVHGTNVMTDSTMLMFWIWGLVFWLHGTESGASRWFVLAGLSVTLGILTKYTCIFLLPLFVFSGIWKYRKPGLWMLAFLVPLGAMAIFEAYTHALYGKGLFSEAFLYANEHTPRSLVDYLDNTLIGLSYLGGCFPVALLLAPSIGKRMLKVAVPILAVLLAVLVYSRGGIGDHSFIRDGSLNPGLIFQFCAFTLAGICLLIACLKEVARRVDHDSLFILLWFFGVFVFACYLNWTINARSFITLAPVAGILLSRRLAGWKIHEKPARRYFAWSMMGVAGLLAVAVMHADFTWAGTARTAAGEIMEKYENKGKVWFQGHWGFQYYMEQRGARPMDLAGNEVQPGDFVVIPVNNTGLARLHPRFVMIEDFYYSHGSSVATMSPNQSAGFYSTLWGPMPYVLEAPARERYLIFRKASQ